MFTGLVEAVGVVRGFRKTGSVYRLSVECPAVVPELRFGQSVSVSGACLTVVSSGAGIFDAEMMPETLVRTRFASLSSGSPVNIERAMTLGGRLEGHMVLGHVDGTANLEKLTGGADSKTALFRLPGPEPEKITRQIVSKGSVAVDGVSLTVIGVGADFFSVGLIPATLENTTLGRLKPDDAVNVETDVIGKYMERFFGGLDGRLPEQRTLEARTGALTFEELYELGY